MQWGKTVISYSPNILRLFVFCLLCLLVCLLCLIVVAFACLFVVFVFCCICLFLCCVFCCCICLTMRNVKEALAHCRARSVYILPLSLSHCLHPLSYAANAIFCFSPFFASCFFLSKVLLCPFLSDELLYVVPLHLYLKFMLITHC